MAYNRGVRSEKELLNQEEYNYYFVYGIQPTDDPDKIRNTINGKRWDTANKTNNTNWRYSDLKNDAIKVMVEDVGFDTKTDSYSAPGARDKELANAKKFKLDNAVTYITYLGMTNKIIFKGWLEDSVEESWFSFAELKAAVDYLFKKNGVEYIDDTQSEIDFDIYEKIEKRLSGGEKDSVYAVLELDASTATVSECNAAITRVWPEYRGKDPKSDNIKNMLGFAKQLFKTEETKRKYDDYLKIKDQVLDKLSKLHDLNITTITVADYLDYAEIIKNNLGMTEAQAKCQLAACLKHYKIVLATGGFGENLNFDYCPYPDCGKAYEIPKDKPLRVCPHCGKALEILCWNCNGKMPYTSKNKTCPTCGCTDKTKTLFDAKLEDIKNLSQLPSSSVKELESALLNLKNVVPSYQSFANSTAYKRINEYEKIISQKIKEEETIGANYKKDVAKVQDQMALKNYQQAKRLALGLRGTYSTYNAANTASLINNIDKELGLAQAQVQQAKLYAAQKNENQVIACVVKALELCNDYGEARQILPTPETPSNFRVNITENNTARIEWTKNGNQTLTTYTIIRKVGSKPTSINDGTVIESNLTINFYEDNKIVSATPYYYAVFADRCGKPSGLVSGNGAVQIFLDVDNVHQEVVTDSISVKWDVPHNVKSIEVWKKDGPLAPANAGDGVRVATNALGGFTDTAASGECSYLILCQYEAGGIKRYSKGVRRVFKKYEQLQKLDKVSIWAQPTGEFVFKCNNLQNGKVSIVYSKERLSCRQDTVLQMLDFNTLCKNAVTAKITYDAEQNMLFTLPQNQVLWVYPVLSNEQLFILSAPILASTIDGIRNVSFSEINGTVKISGTLDSRIKNVIVKISNNKFPLDINDDGDKLLVPKDRFEAEKGVAIKLKPDTLSYISVFTEIEQNGKTAYTRAVPISDEPIGTLSKRIVQYAIEYTASPKKFAVKIKFSADEAIEIPRLCVVKGSPRPMNKTSGEPVAIIDPFSLKKGLFSANYTAKQTVVDHDGSSKMKFAVFVDDDSAKYIRLKEVKKI